MNALISAIKDKQKIIKNPTPSIEKIQPTVNFNGLQVVDGHQAGTTKIFELKIQHNNNKREQKTDNRQEQTRL